MKNNNFDFNAFLKDNNLTSKAVVEKTGLGVNTLTKWLKLTTDEKIHQESILKLLKGYPKLDLKKYFPTHAKIIKLSKK